MKVLILGGDGFTGWPLALYLSNRGYSPTIVDNFVRRKIDAELGAQSLTPIRSLSERLKTWFNLTEKKIEYVFIDLEKDYNALSNLIRERDFETVVHLAEQKSAPYSMKSSYHSRQTIVNNTTIMSNLLNAVVENGKKCHIIHLGTMGVYGYGSIDAEIPEGYLNVRVKNSGGNWVESKILYPPGPGSVYHMTKCMDHIMLAFYAKNYAVPCTDLHQGVVWGTLTDETSIDERLINRFDYDSDYGTVLNRFMLQGALDVPLTVYGSGGQTRAFIHIKDTVECIRLAIENVPKNPRKVAVFNQTAETQTIRELAELISSITGTEIKYYKNPRSEATENTLVVSNKGFKNLGWNPILIKNDLINEVMDVAKKYSHRMIEEIIPPSTTWNKNIELDKVGKFKKQQI